MSDEKTVLADGIEVVPCDFDRGAAVAAVVVIPFLGAHEGRNTEACGSGKPSHECLAFLAGE